MNRLLQRVPLPLLCGLSLILVPISTWAQSTTATPQDRTDQTDVNQANQNVDHAQDQNQDQDRGGQRNLGQNDINREKPSGTTDPNATQNQQNSGAQTKTHQDANKQPANRSESEYGKDVNQRNQADNANRELPATAGELPLLAITGFLSLICACATRAFAKSIR